MSHLSLRLSLGIALSLVLMLLLVGAFALGVLTTQRVEAHSTPAAVVFLPPPPPIFSDDFNDNSLDPAKWTANDLFSGFSDLSLPLTETSQRLGNRPTASEYRRISLPRCSHNQQL